MNEQQEKNLKPTWKTYAWIAVITVVIIAAALMIISQLRKNGGGALDAESAEALLLENEDVWLHDSTAGICLLDLDGDGTPELLATDTEIVWYEELGTYYFGDSNVSVYSLSADAVTPAGGYTTDEYCFLATLHRYTDAGGNTGWYYTSSGDVWLLSLEKGEIASSAAVSMPDVSGGDGAMKLIRNESWVLNAGDTPDKTVVSEDVRAIAAEYFAAK